MKRIILSIFALSMLLNSCQEVTIQVFRQCGVMTISDALPVQFWLADCETYNEYEAEGVHRACWCQPWNCDDEIKIQFTDDSSPDLDFILLVKDRDGEYIHETPISETQNGVYQRSIIPEDEGICDESIQLLIASDSDIERMLAPSTWSNISGVSAFDSKGASTFVEAITSADNNIGADMPLVVPAGTVITFTYTVEVSGTWAGNAIPIFVAFTLVDGAEANVSTGTLSVAEKTVSENGTFTLTETLVATATTANLRVFVVEALDSGTADLTITIPVESVLYVPTASIFAKSDCLDIATAHDETIFFEYSNHRNFAGLIYENDSPDITFGIRVPARFVHESFPEEDEAMELTSSIIITSSQQKTQRELEVKHAPYYFHKKMMLVLKHQTVSAYDRQWKKEGNYQLNDGNKRWPLKSATCLLTEKNSPVRNVL